eukprot:g876.t1
MSRYGRYACHTASPAVDERFGFPAATPVTPNDASQHGSKSGDDPRPVDAVGDDDLDARLTDGPAADAAANGHGNPDARLTDGPAAAANGHGNYDARLTDGPDDARLTDGPAAAANGHGNPDARLTDGPAAAANGHGNHDAAANGHGNHDDGTDDDMPSLASQSSSESDDDDDNHDDGTATVTLGDLDALLSERDYGEHLHDAILHLQHVRERKRDYVNEMKAIFDDDALSPHVNDLRVMALRCEDQIMQLEIDIRAMKDDQAQKKAKASAADTQLATLVAKKAALRDARTAAYADLSYLTTKQSDTAIKSRSYSDKAMKGHKLDEHEEQIMHELLNSGCDVGRRIITTQAHVASCNDQMRAIDAQIEGLMGPTPTTAPATVHSAKRPRSREPVPPPPPLYRRLLERTTSDSMASRGAAGRNRGCDAANELRKQFYNIAIPAGTTSPLADFHTLCDNSVERVRKVHHGFGVPLYEVCTHMSAALSALDLKDEAARHRLGEIAVLLKSSADHDYVRAKQMIASFCHDPAFNEVAAVALRSSIRRGRVSDGGDGGGGGGSGGSGRGRGKRKCFNCGGDAAKHTAFGRLNSDGVTVGHCTAPLDKTALKTNLQEALTVCTIPGLKQVWGDVLRRVDSFSTTAEMQQFARKCHADCVAKNKAATKADC